MDSLDEWFMQGPADLGDGPRTPENEVLEDGAHEDLDLNLDMTLNLDLNLDELFSEPLGFEFPPLDPLPELALEDISGILNFDQEPIGFQHQGNFEQYQDAPNPVPNFEQYQDASNSQQLQPAQPNFEQYQDAPNQNCQPNFDQYFEQDAPIFIEYEHVQAAPAQQFLAPAPRAQLRAPAPRAQSRAAPAFQAPPSRAPAFQAPAPRAPPSQTQQRAPAPRAQLRAPAFQDQLRAPVAPRRAPPQQPRAPRVPRASAPRAPPPQTSTQNAPNAPNQQNPNPEPHNQEKNEIDPPMVGSRVAVDLHNAILQRFPPPAIQTTALNAALAEPPRRRNERTGRMEYSRMVRVRKQMLKKAPKAFDAKKPPPYLYPVKIARRQHPRHQPGRSQAPSTSTDAPSDAPVLQNQQNVDPRANQNQSWCLVSDNGYQNENMIPGTYHEDPMSQPGTSDSYYQYQMSLEHHNVGFGASGSEEVFAQQPGTSESYYQYQMSSDQNNMEQAGPSSFYSQAQMEVSRNLHRVAPNQSSQHAPNAHLVVHNAQNHAQSSSNPQGSRKRNAPSQRPLGPVQIVQNVQNPRQMFPSSDNQYQR